MIGGFIIAHRIPLYFSDTYRSTSGNNRIISATHPPHKIPIVHGEVPPFSGNGLISACCELGAGYALIHIPQVAGFQVFTDRVVVTPDPDAVAATLNHFLYSTALTFLLHLRGVPVLRASSVVLPNGQAVLFCGVSTSGKSTLAAALCLRGYQALADDWVTLQFNDLGEPCVVPLSPDLQLPANALSAIPFPKEGGELQRVRPHLDKFLFSQPTTSTPVPIARIYELDIDDGQEVSLQPIHGLERIHTLTRYAYIQDISAASDRQNQELSAYVRLAQVTTMRRLTRSQLGCSIAETLALLEKDWA